MYNFIILSKEKVHYMETWGQSLF